MQSIENTTTDYNNQKPIEPIEATMTQRTGVQRQPSFIANSFANISNLVTGGGSGSFTTSDSDSLSCRRTRNDSPSSLSSSIVDVASTTNNTRSRKNDKKKNTISDSHSINSIAQNVVNDPLEWKKFKEACAANHGTSSVLTTRMALESLPKHSKNIGRRTSNGGTTSAQYLNQTKKASATTSRKKKMTNKKNKNGLLSSPPPPIFMREESVSTPNVQSVKLFFAHQMTLH